jgi:hypothetical protein
MVVAVNQSGRRLPPRRVAGVGSAPDMGSGLAIWSGAAALYVAFRLWYDTR